MTLGEAISEVVLGIQDRALPTDALAERAFVYMGGGDPKAGLASDLDIVTRTAWAALARLVEEYSWSSFALLAGNKDCADLSLESARYDAFKARLLKGIRDYWTAWLDDRKGMSA